MNSGYVDEAFLASIDSGSATLAPLAEKEASIVELLREMTVESLYQMNRKGSSFEVTESSTSPYSSPRAFELEAVLEESRRRAHESTEVQKRDTDLDGVIKMNRDLGEQDSVKIGRRRVASPLRDGIGGIGAPDRRASWAPPTSGQLG